MPGLTGTILAFRGGRTENYSERKPNVAIADFADIPPVVRQVPQVRAASLPVTNAAWAQSLALFRQAAQSYTRMLEISRSARSARTRAPIHDPGLRDQAPARAAKTCDLAILTPREREVAALLADGRTNQQIAELLVIERGTVANHVAHILHKLGVSNRTQVALLVRPVH